MAMSAKRTSPPFEHSAALVDLGLIPALSRDLHQGPVLPVALGRLSIEAGRLRAARPACRRYPTDTRRLS